MIWRAMTALAISSAVLLPGRAVAGLNCDTASAMLSFFQQKYAEVPAFSGVTSGGIVIVVLTSPTGTFTILGVMDDKLCVFGAGKAVQAAPDAPKAEPGNLPQAILPTPARLANGLLRI